MGRTLVGRVLALRRYPVKSMLGEDLRQVSIDRRGVVGDRAYGLIDVETQKVVSVKRPRRWARMFELRAITTGGTVEVQFPDGSSVSIGDAGLADRLSDFLGRAVSVASTPPEGATFDEVWARELKNGVDPMLGMPSRTEDGEEIIDNGQFMSVSGNFSNGGAIHIVTTSSVQRLATLSPQSRFDAFRFRPNIVVETDGSEFVENDWPGQVLRIGDVELRVVIPTPRCVMTTLPQAESPGDREVLRSISQHNSIDLGFGVLPCLGVYADVATEGDIAVDAPVALGPP
jgi:uncharacterized protein